jgi:hypothetical protein
MTSTVTRNIRQRYVTGSEPYWPDSKLGLSSSGREHYRSRQLPAIRVLEQLKDRVDQREALARQMEDSMNRADIELKRIAWLEKLNIFGFRRKGSRETWHERYDRLELKLLGVERQISDLQKQLKEVTAGSK